MNGTFLVDTNVFVYAADRDEPEKRATARRWLATLWRESAGRTSIQVLSEYHVTMTRGRQVWDPEEAWRRVERLFAWRPIAIDERLLRRAEQVQRRFQLSWWDSLIVAAAQLQACDHLLTEDLQDGQDLDGVTVVDPFVHAPEAYA